MDNTEVKSSKKGLLVITFLLIIVVVGTVCFVLSRIKTENKNNEPTEEETTKVVNNNKIDGLYEFKVSDEEISKLIDEKKVGDSFEYNLSDDIKIAATVEAFDEDDNYKSLSEGKVIVDGNVVYNTDIVRSISVNIIDDFMIICEYLDQMAYKILIQTNGKVVKNFYVQSAGEYQNKFPYTAKFNDDKLVIDAYADSDIEGKCLVKDSVNGKFYSVKYEFTKDGKYKMTESKESKYIVAGAMTGDCE